MAAAKSDLAGPLVGMVRSAESDRCLFQRVGTKSRSVTRGGGQHLSGPDARLGQMDSSVHASLVSGAAPMHATTGTTLADARVGAAGD